MAGITFTSNARNVEQAMEQTITRMLTKIGLYTEGKIKEKITQMDAVDTGYLRNSIDSKVVSSEKKLAIGTNCSYAIFVHEGTRRMRQRPFIKKTVLEEKDKITQIATDELQRGLP